MVMALSRAELLKRVVLTLWVGTFVFIAVKSVATPTKRTMYPHYAETAREWISEGQFTSIISYQYLPYFGDLMAPFAAMPDGLGSPCWAILCFVVYGTGIRAFLRVHAPESGPAGVGRDLALLCGLCVGCGSLSNGQSNLLIIGSWLWAAVAVRDRRWWAAAFLFALPMFKMYTLVAGLVFAFLYPRQLAGRLAVCVGVLLALPFLFHPDAAVWHRHETALAYLTGGDHYRIFNFQTLYEAWLVCIGPIDPARLLPVQALAGLAVPLVLALRRWRGADHAELEKRGLFLTAMWCVSFGPSIEPQTYILVAPALGWWLARCVAGPRPSRVGAAFVTAAVIMAGSPLYTFFRTQTGEATNTKLPWAAMALCHLAFLVVAAGRPHGVTTRPLPPGSTARGSRPPIWHRLRSRAAAAGS